MPRLIDAEALKQQFRHPIDYSDVYVRHMIDAAPTVDPERATGCEHCCDIGRYKAIRAELFHQVAADEIYNIDIPVNYCPNCGAKIGKEG